MDVIDEGKLRDQLVNPTLDRLKNEIIPALQETIEHEISGALPRIDKVLQDAITNAGAQGELLLGQLRDLVSGLNGWTVEIAIPTITIPPVTIRLSKPATQMELPK